MLVSALYSHVTCSQYTDDVEPLLQMNRDNYLAGVHSTVRQQAALQYFDQTWSWLNSSQACGNHILGNAGKMCTADRSRDGRWPWQVWYRDTIIANSLDPRVPLPRVRD
jgi:hypothetical protein